MTGTLLLICGLPGSGKTTLAKRLEQERNAIRFCPDEWIEQILTNPTHIQERDRLRDPIENLQWDLAKTYLQKGLTVILENGFWAEEERTQYACEALAVAAKVELHFCHVESERRWQRILVRNKQLKNKTFLMNRQEHDEAQLIFQKPTQEELAFYDTWAIYD